MSQDNVTIAAGTGNAGNLPPDSPFIDLNAIVLSIEWEITDEIMASFLAEVEKLKASFSGDKIMTSFLQLHGSVGKYISARKVAAHPGSIKLLHSVHEGLLKILLANDLQMPEKQKILSEEINKFKILKQQIAESKSAASVKSAPVQAETENIKTDNSQTKPPVSETELSEAMVWAVEQIKETIREEFKSLKEALIKTIHP